MVPGEGPLTLQDAGCVSTSSIFIFTRDLKVYSHSLVAFVQGRFSADKTQLFWLASFVHGFFFLLFCFWGPFLATNAAVFNNKWPFSLLSSEQMQESFSRGSVSCLINTNPHADQDPAEDQKSDPCWRVTQQLHQHIEKVSTPPPPRVGITEQLLSKRRRALTTCFPFPVLHPSGHG